MIGTAESRRIGARHVEAVHARQAEVEHDQVRAQRPGRREGRRPVGRGHDVEAGVREVVARELDDPRLVVDDEDPAHRGNPTAPIARVVRAGTGRPGAGPGPDSGPDQNVELLVESGGAGRTGGSGRARRARWSHAEVGAAARTRRRAPSCCWRCQASNVACIGGGTEFTHSLTRGSFGSTGPLARPQPPRAGRTSRRVHPSPGRRPTAAAGTPRRSGR